jgi:hypothetical protein
LQDVQDISFDVCESLTKSAFCTAPEVNLNLFRTAKGHDLKKANFDAAARLESKGGFTRMFIFKSFASIAPEDYLLMKENVANKVRVLVALEHKIDPVLKKHNWDARSDFGPSWNESLARLRRFDRSSPTHIDGLSPADLTEGAVYEIAWPTLHSREFYDSEQCSLDFGGWDKRLMSEPGDADFLAKLRLQYNHRVTSLEFERLKQLASPYFEVVEDYPVHSVWATNRKLASLPEALQVSERFKEYYRILVFERCDHAIPPAD